MCHGAYNFNLDNNTLKHISTQKHMAENKYQRGKIYRITSDQTDRVYIGSTTEKTLACRMRKHRDNYRRYLAGNHHRVTSFDILRYADAQIILIENYPCQNKDELRAREQHYIAINAGHCINKHKALQTAEERQKYLKDYKREHGSECHNCNCGGKYVTDHKARHEKSQKHQQYLEQDKKAVEWLNTFVTQELGL